MKQSKGEGNGEIFYVGTFGDSFYTVALDAKENRLSLLGETRALRCPDVFALDPAKKVLYVGSENSGGRGGRGGVSAYELQDPLKPRLISELVLPSAGPCHLALVGEGETACLVASGYFDGSVQAFSLNRDGGVSEMCSQVLVSGSGPYRHPEYISRQDQARMHCVVPIKFTPFFACADLGGDRIYLYRLSGGRIEQAGCKKLRSGSGPRHIACSASGRTWYLVDELDCCVSVLDFAPDTLRLEVRQRISALPDAWTGDSWCSAIHLSYDERFLYVGNRGYDSIAVFPLQAQGKRLAPPAWFRQEVSAPREFAFDLTGDYMLIGGMQTDCITLNRVDRESGMPQFVSKLPGIQRPACIQTAGCCIQDTERPAAPGR